MAKITVKIYGCYQLTYNKTVYEDILRRVYGPNINMGNVSVQIEDISKDAKGNTLRIQSQRSLAKYVTRTVRIYEDNVLKHIVGISNTNYDEDKKAEFDAGRSIKKKSTYGVHGYHANTYLIQGIAGIFNYYFSLKDPNVDLSFYLLDIDESYPHNLFNILIYRQLETLDFKILNIDKIRFDLFNDTCHTTLSAGNIKYSRLSKLINDIAYISKKNSGNNPSFLQTMEVEKVDPTTGKKELVEKYVYTFKSLSAQSYDSLIRCMCLKKLADKDNLDIEFRLGMQYFAYGQSVMKTATKLTGPTLKAFNNIGININYVTNKTFMDEKSAATNTYLRHKAANELRNQTLFKNNMFKKGMPWACVICGEDNSSILDAAHIWEVQNIKDAKITDINKFISSNSLEDLIDKTSTYKNEIFFKKYCLVNSGENGVWLCKNHHGLFDKNYYCFDSKDGKVILYFKDPADAQEFNDSIQADYEDKMADYILTDATKAFMLQRQLRFTV